MGLNLWQAGPPGSPTTCGSGQGHQRRWRPWTAWPGPAQGPPLWPLRAPSHLTPVPGPSGSAAAPLPPLCPGRAAPGAAGIPGVVVKRRGEGGQGLCPNPKPTHFPPWAPTHQVASKAMTMVWPLGNLTAALSALNRLGPEKCSVPPQVAQPTGEELDLEPGLAPHRRVTNPGSTLEGCPSGEEAAEFQEKEPWTSRLQA